MIALVRKIDLTALIWKTILAVAGGAIVISTAIDAVCIWAHEYYEALTEMRDILMPVGAVFALIILLRSTRIGCITLPLILIGIVLTIVAGFNIRPEDTDYEVYSMATFFGWIAIIALAVYLVVSWLNSKATAKS